MIIDFPQREYEPVSGRWFTPDPAGLAAVDPNNPQTWNRYAYVGNRPLSLIDPLGLDGCTASSKLNTLPSPNGSTIGTSSADFGPYDPGSDGGSDASAGEDGGINCIDGVDVGNLLDEMISEGGGGGSSSADVCPSGCETDAWVNNNPNDPNQGGHWQYVQYEGFAGAAANASGYYNPNDLANGVHDLDGKIYNDTGYAQQAKYDSYQACESLSGAVKDKGVADYTDIVYMQGGHYNYAFTCQVQVAACAGRWPGGDHIEWYAAGKTVVIHFDSASPYIGPRFNLGTFNPYNFIQHVLADVVYGTICNCVLPH